MKSIYLIRTNDGRYKIGTSNNPKKRIYQLQTGNSDRLELIDVYQSENARRIESTLHRYYSYGRMIGEWFLLSIEEESKFIGNCVLLDRTFELLEEKKYSVKLLDGY